ncbi:MAG: hypothetical protein LBR44_00590 [Clostridiales Family XIII bacterium]|nr:hypothetical protein [Clostridiales Family XIII bacterium]
MLAAVVSFLGACGASSSGGVEEYRYRDREWTTNATGVAPDGYTLDPTRTQVAETAWSEWSRTAPADASAAETRVWGYALTQYVTREADSKKRHFRNFSVRDNLSGLGLDTGYGEASRSLEIDKATYDAAPKVAVGDYYDGGNYAQGYNSGNVEAVVLTVNDELSDWKPILTQLFPDGEILEYRSPVSGGASASAVYYYYRWGEYSEWSETQPEATADREIQVRRNGGEIETISSPGTADAEGDATNSEAAAAYAAYRDILEQNREGILSQEQVGLERDDDNEAMSRPVAFVDIDGDGVPELFFSTSGLIPDSGGLTQEIIHLYWYDGNGAVEVVFEDGRTYYGFPWAWASSDAYCSAALFLDGDGGLVKFSAAGQAGLDYCYNTYKFSNGKLTWGYELAKIPTWDADSPYEYYWIDSLSPVYDGDDPNWQASRDEWFSGRKQLDKAAYEEMAIEITDQASTAILASDNLASTIRMDSEFYEPESAMEPIAAASTAALTYDEAIAWLDEQIAALGGGASPANTASPPAQIGAYDEILQGDLSAFYGQYPYDPSKQSELTSDDFDSLSEDGFRYGSMHAWYEYESGKTPTKVGDCYEVYLVGANAVAIPGQKGYLLLVPENAKAPDGTVSGEKRIIFGSSPFHFADSPIVGIWYNGASDADAAAYLETGKVPNSDDWATADYFLTFKSDGTVSIAGYRYRCSGTWLVENGKDVLISFEDCQYDSGYGYVPSDPFPNECHYDAASEELTFLMEDYGAHTAAPTPGIYHKVS